MNAFTDIVTQSSGDVVKEPPGSLSEEVISIFVSAAYKPCDC